MADTTAPALPPIAPPARPRMTSIGTAFASLGTIMFFAGLIGFYLSQRSAALATDSPWLEGFEIPLTPPHVMMLTLAMSLVTISWAYYAIVNDDRPNAYLAMGLTLLFGVAFINAQAYLYSLMGLALRETFQAVLIYCITGAYLAVLGAAMLYLVITAFRALAGEYSPRQHDGVAGAVMYWYVVVAIYAVIWIAIYITK
jgi:cytochrome c oxidase subunit 3